MEIISNEYREAQRITSINPACSPQPLPSVTIEIPPAHGVVKFVSSTDWPHFPPKNPLSACNGLQVPILRVMYTPESDFSGADFFSIAVAQTDKPTQTITFAIHMH